MCGTGVLNVYWCFDDAFRSTKRNVYKINVHCARNAVQWIQCMYVSVSVDSMRSVSIVCVFAMCVWCGGHKH